MSRLMVLEKVRDTKRGWGCSALSNPGHWQFPLIHQESPLGNRAGHPLSFPVLALSDLWCDSGRGRQHPRGRVKGTVCLWAGFWGGSDGKHHLGKAGGCPIPGAWDAFSK